MTGLGELRSMDEALPGLRAARRAGRLVPFVGAGISRPHCRGWPQFIEALYEGFGASAPNSAAASDPESLYRAADRVAAWLRLRPPGQRREMLRAALHDAAIPALPPQALALASFTWPLVITTNYDDVIPRSLRRRTKHDVRILGRSNPDCAEVVRSLDSLADPIVWYVQGYIGRTDSAREALLDEVVVGHQQYQQAINSGASFRRAFSEVFRRHSLLFIGSGLAESYFVNLIAESLFSLGPSSQAHFALFCDADLQGGVDPDFLAVRLGITPIRYGAIHADLPRALTALADDAVAADWMPRVPGITSQIFAIPRYGGNAVETLSVSLRFARISAPPDGGCTVLSVGRDHYNGRFEPGIGTQAASFLLEQFGAQYKSLATYSDVHDLPQGRMFRLYIRDEPTRVFLLAAREIDDQQDDNARSLAAITEATTQALEILEKAGFRHVAMGLMAAGPTHADEPPYCLIAQLSGIRAFATMLSQAPPGIETVSINIIDDEVWSALAQGRIAVLDLLTSRFARVLVRMFDIAGDVEEFALSVPYGATIGDVLSAYRIADERIEIVARPIPRRSFVEMRDINVFPGMVIKVCPSERTKARSKEAEMNDPAVQPETDPPTSVIFASK